MNRSVGVGAALAVIIVILLLIFAFFPLSSQSPSAPPPTSTSTNSDQTPISSSSISSSTTSFSQSISSSSSSSTSTSTTSSSSTSSSSTTATSSSTPTITTTRTATTVTGTGGSGSITVLGENLKGTAPVNGIYVELRINGNFVANGDTPVTFSHLQLGVQYGVVVYWYGGYYIRYINDSNTGIDLQRYDLVTLTQTQPNDTLTGMFEYVPPAQAASLNIIAQFPNGTQLGTASVVNGYDLHTPGMWLTVTPPFQRTPYTGTFTGGSILPFTFFVNQTYRVDMTQGFCGAWTGYPGYGNIVQIDWSHWKDNANTNPTRAITLNGSNTLIAVYDQVTPTCSSSATSGGGGLNSNASSVSLLVVLIVALGGFGFRKLDTRHKGLLSAGRKASTLEDTVSFVSER